MGADSGANKLIRKCAQPEPLAALFQPLLESSCCLKTTLLMKRVAVIIISLGCTRDEFYT